MIGQHSILVGDVRDMLATLPDGHCEQDEAGDAPLFAEMEAQ